MIDSKFQDIAEKIKKDLNINEKTKNELLNLLSDLKLEIINLSKINNDDANSITNFTETSTHEIIRKNKKPDQTKYALDGLQASIEGLETSYPKLTELVNSISEILSNMGI